MITASIDGKTLNVNRGVNVLQAAGNAGITIPTLCGRNTTGEKIPCGLCVIEIDGVGELHKACETELTEGMKVTTQSDRIAEARRSALETILSDHYADCEAPCQSACPAGIDVQSYVFEVAKGNYHKAVRIIKEKLPMPLSIGRVCPAFCEVECRRNLVDDAVGIRQLKRHAADLDLGDAWQYVPPKAADRGKTVAIVGGGPAGLSCGYYLSNDGYDVTVFESMPEPGGWLRYGIPEYRLPKDILDQEIELLCRNGMQIKCGVKLGTDITLNQLNKDYDVVYLAIGASKGVPMKYQGSDLDGCYLGVEYLKDFVTERKMVTGKKVAVIGGGNTAIDCARTAVREGADVTLVYRRTREEMPAAAYEVEEAELEGVKFLFLTNPVENIADDQGRVKEIKLEKMALAEPDASGRRRPIPTGDFVVEPFDTVIAAISQTPDVSFLDHEENKPGDRDIPLTRWSTADADEDTMYVGLENIFAIGDFRRGPATAVEAIADGRKAAISIERFLGGTLHDAPIKEFNSRKERSLKRVDARHYQHFPAVPRNKMSELALEERKGNFQEVETGYPEGSAMDEATRCLNCGCQVNTTCQLRQYATDYELENTNLYNERRQKFDVDTTSPFIAFDANRCISCGQCVVACNDHAVHKVLGFKKTGPIRRIDFDDEAGSKMADSTCVQCGSCVQACPVGAMVDCRDQSQGRLVKLKEIDTICSYCGVGCKLRMHVSEELNQIAYVTGVEDSPVNKGMLCVKGRYGFDFVGSSRRLTTPLVRNAQGKLEEASWEDALKLVAKRFKEIVDSDGPDSMAGFSSAKTTNEDNYLFQKFMRSVIGTNNVDHCARLCHASTVAGLAQALGSGAMTNDIAGVTESDAVFIIGSDTTSAHPIIGSYIKQAVTEGRTKLVVADPKKIAIADYADIYVAQRPGSDVMLLNGLMREIITNGWENKQFIEDRCENFEELKAEVMKDEYTPENVERVSGVPAKKVRKMARILAKSQKVAVFYSMGITQHTTGRDNVWSIANLQMLTGNVGRVGTGINPLRGQSNVQGACDMGALPVCYPGYQKVDDPQIREKFSKAWNHPGLSDKPGLAMTEAIDRALDGTIKTLYIMGENPVLSDPDQAHVIEAFEKMEFVVVQDIFLTETAELADVVLPAYSFAEKTGHFTNTERRVQRVNPAVNPPGESRDDWRVVQDIAVAMGADWNYNNVPEITAEICEVTPQYAGLSWERLGADGLHWPCPTRVHPGTPILHTEQFSRGRGLFKGIEFKEPAELPCESYPLVMTTGRVLQQFHTGTMSRKTQGLNKLAGPMVMISVDDAEQLGITNSENVRVSTRRGTIETPAFVTKRIPRGTIFVPFHYAEAPANRLTINALDPYAKIPEFKVCAARVEKTTPA